MRLINAKTLVFEEFFESQVPPYIILSHRWAGKETTMRGFEADRSLHPDMCSSGITKIKRFCEMVLRAGCNWCWVDTCCIDKTSSAELTEAINSMWSWYANARTCYVYLSDIIEGPEDDIEAQLRKSSWLSRGWTLQEMLAPKSLQFFDAYWVLLGDRDDALMRGALFRITGIDTRYLGNLEEIRSASVVERMRWISNRQTSRTEDIAYCLLGIFGVHMPLIYGEGLNAFFRLQSEIIKVTDDETIFAWIDPDGKQSGLLADHPRCFARTKELDIQPKTWIDRAPYQITNKGIELEVFASTFDRSFSSIEVPINCWIQNNGQNNGWIVLNMKKVDSNTWYRADCSAMDASKSPSEGDDPNREPESDVVSWSSERSRPFANGGFGSTNDTFNRGSERREQKRLLEGKRKRVKIYVRQHHRRAAGPSKTSPKTSRQTAIIPYVGRA